MGQVNYNCNTKDIPIPSKKEYRIQLIHSTKKFFDNLCWRVFHFKNPRNKEKTETYGFSSTNKVPSDDDLNNLESDLYYLTENIEYREVKSNFHKNLSDKINIIKSEQQRIQI